MRLSHVLLLASALLAGCDDGLGPLPPSGAEPTDAGPRADGGAIVDRDASTAPPAAEADADADARADASDAADVTDANDDDDAPDAAAIDASDPDANDAADASARDASDANDASDASDATIPPPPDADHDGVPDANDCAPSDDTKWQLLDYAYRDADGDGYTVGASGRVCAGAALPAGYATGARGDDCDDANPKVFAAVAVYPDVDGDGVGAGSATTVCTDGTAPPGASLSSTDCAPNDDTKWQTLAYAFVDRDGDGFTAPEAGSICAGAALPPPYYATARGNDCDDANDQRTHWDVLWPDADGDGAGGGAYVFRCDGATIPGGYSRYGDDEDDHDVKVGPLPAEDILDLVLP